MANYIYIVTIELDTFVRLTDCHRDFVYDDDTYTSGKLKVENAIEQKSAPSANDFDLTISAVDQTMVSVFANNPYKGRRCLIQRLELDDDENVIDMMIWLDGELNKYTYTNSLNESTIKLTVSSIFAAFSAVKMLNLAIQFADSINEDDNLYWGKAAPVTTPETHDYTPYTPSNTNIEP